MQFIKNNSEVDILVWVNSIAPFQTGTEIKKIVSFFYIIVGSNILFL